LAKPTSGVALIKTETNMFDQPLPHLKGRYCINKDPQGVLNTSRATIDRWCRERPYFPKKIKLGIDGAGNCSPRFLAGKVRAYLRQIEKCAGIGMDI
jgi:predicted DNA-binding transcriptional regulator AlpA